MFNFLELEPESFGLDISELSLRAVSLKRRGSAFKLTSSEEIEIKEGLIKEGEIRYEDALAKEIKKLLGKAKIDNKNVAASLPEKKSFIQVIKMPKMQEKDLETAVPFEAENHIPLPIEQSYLGYEVLSSGSQFEILVAAVSKKIVDSYFSCLKKAGLTPRALEIESQSVARALIKDGFSKDPVLIIDLGKSTTSFIIFHGQSIVFTSSISINSQDLTEAIAGSLNIDLKEAEKLKIKYGIKRIKRKESKDTADAMAPLLNDFVSQMAKYINYYHSFDKKKKIKKIILTGRGSNLKGLTDFLSFELKTPSEIGNPWINILPKDLKEVPELSFADSAGYATALGLALRGLKK